MIRVNSDLTGLLPAKCSEMKVQENTDLLLRLEEELDKAKASDNMSKAELDKLQSAYDNMVEEKTGLEAELADLQKKRLRFKN